MSDPSQGGAPAPAPSAPIQVKASAAPIITSQTFQIIVMAGGGVVVDRLLQSDVSRAAVLPVFAIAAVGAWGLLNRLHTWRCMRFMERHVPDSVAVVGKKPWWEFWS